MRPLIRVDPALPAEHMKTYGFVAPKETHFRPATCEEVDCGNYQRGWVTKIDEATVLGKQQAFYIRQQSGRKFAEDREGELTAFVFEPGQCCFAEHSVSLEREPIYLVKEGDWRGNPRGTPPRIHARPADWVDDFATHQDQLIERLERS